MHHDSDWNYVNRADQNRVPNLSRARFDYKRKDEDDMAKMCIRDRPVTRHFDVAVIISMNRQASCLTAGASEPMKLEICDYIIIKIWSYRIVFFDVKSYHSLALNTRALPVR